MNVYTLIFLNRVMWCTSLCISDVFCHYELYVMGHGADHMDTVYIQHISRQGYTTVTLYDYHMDRHKFLPDAWGLLEWGLSSQSYQFIPYISSAPFILLQISGTLHLGLIL